MISYLIFADAIPKELNQVATGCLVRLFAASSSSGSIDRIPTLMQRIDYRMISLSPLVCSGLQLSWAHPLLN